MKAFGGPILFLDRADINTDEIIPAKYLTEIAKEAMGPHLLEDLSLGGFDPARDIPGKRAVVSRSNFGCGSSREHAPWALEANGITLVIAGSFARIFRQNMYNGGMLAVELPAEDIDRIFREFAGQADARVDVRLEDGIGRLTFSGGGGERVVEFPLAGFDRALVQAGGWLEFADARY